jgi:general secretion pathway protein G
MRLPLTRGLFRDGRGLTFVELLLVLALMGIVALSVSPLVHHRLRRHKEIELRRALETMRSAIDSYHEYAALGLIEPWDLDWNMYPETLDSLVDGIEVTLTPPDATQQAEPVLMRFLREIPVDPITGQRDWACRSYEDDPDERSSSCDDIYDVFSTSPDQALDGSYYADW